MNKSNSKKHEQNTYLGVKAWAWFVNYVISFDPNGDVLNGNVYKTDILGIIRSYRP